MTNHMILGCCDDLHCLQQQEALKYVHSVQDYFVWNS